MSIMIAETLAEPVAVPPEPYQPKVLAITGTNGKTTTTTLTGALCRACGLATEVAGNISPAALDALMRVLDAGAVPEAWVLELSSFQLETTDTLDADAATVLNVTQDHLDRHPGGMPAYAAEKARIFGAHTVQVLNRDDPWVSAMRRASARVIGFGDGVPVAGDYGLNRLVSFLDRDQLSLRVARKVFGETFLGT